MAEEYVIMRIRLSKANQKGSNLLSIDPKSLALLGYAKIVEFHYQTFKVKIEEGTDGDLYQIPNLLFEETIIYEIEEFRKTSAVLEKLRGIPPNSLIEITQTFISDIEKACVRGLKRLQPEEQLWQLRDNEEETDMVLSERAKISFKALSEMLVDNAYLLDMYYGKGDACGSYLDAKLFGAGIVIYNCFRPCNTVDHYCSSLHDNLKSYLNLDAYFDRLNAQLVLSQSFKINNYNQKLYEDPTIYTQFMRHSKLIARSRSRVYEYNCDAMNPLELPAGTYALKVTRTSDHGPSFFEREIQVCEHLRHRSFLPLIGHGRTHDKSGLSSDEISFMIFPMMKNRDLSNNIEELDWPSTFKLSREIAYSVHIAHTSFFILSDLKPPNILIDDDGHAIMCDFDLFQFPYERLRYTADTGTQLYRDSSMVMDRLVDIYSYGVILLQMLSGQKNISKDFFVTIRRKIEDGETIITERLKNSGCDEQIAAKMIKMAFDCIQNEREMRPSALTIVRWLDAMVVHDEAVAVVRDETEMRSMSKATNSHGTRRLIFGVGGIAVLALLAIAYTVRKSKKG